MVTHGPIETCQFVHHHPNDQFGIFDGSGRDQDYFYGVPINGEHPDTFGLRNLKLVLLASPGP